LNCRFWQNELKITVEWWWCGGAAERASKNGVNLKISRSPSEILCGQLEFIVLITAEKNEIGNKLAKKVNLR
jgi:hypothetical protein